MLNIVSLSATYRGYAALNGVSLVVQPGECVALVGPNGAGKSTLLKGILGLLPLTAGQAFWRDLPVAAVRRRVAYLPQRSRVDWDYPVSAGNVVLMGRTAQMGWWRGFDRSARRAAQEAMERLGVWGLRYRPVGQLSGGQQQRVFLARAIAQEAELIMFDEPLAAVDRQSAHIVNEAIAQLRQAGKAILVATHEWGDDLGRYDRLVLLNRSVIAAGVPAAVMTPENLRRAYDCSDLMPMTVAEPTRSPFAC